MIKTTRAVIRQQHIVRTTQPLILKFPDHGHPDTCYLRLVRTIVERRVSNFWTILPSSKGLWHSFNETNMVDMLVDMGRTLVGVYAQ